MVLCSNPKPASAGTIRSVSNLATTTWTSMTSLARSPGTDVEAMWSIPRGTRSKSCPQSLSELLKVSDPLWPPVTESAGSSLANSRRRSAISGSSTRPGQFLRASDRRNRLEHLLDSGGIFGPDPFEFGGHMRSDIREGQTVSRLRARRSIRPPFLSDTDRVVQDLDIKRSRSGTPKARVSVSNADPGGSGRPSSARVLDHRNSSCSRAGRKG